MDASSLSGLRKNGHRPVEDGELEISSQLSRISRPEPGLAGHYDVGMQTPADTGPGEATSGGASDRDLIARFLATREESAFATLVARYSRLVMLVARQTLRDPHAAEDAFQATFLVLARSARRIRNRDSLASWLHGTAFRVSSRLLRTRRRRNEQDLPPVDLPSPIWADPVPPDESSALNEELARLSEGLRAPLVLHYLEGRSVPEIARELQMSQSAVEGRLRRGKATLRKRLLKRGVLLSSALHGMGLLVPAEAQVASTLVQSTVAACLAAAASRSLAPVAASTASTVALEEIASMTHIALMKTVMACAGVAGFLGLAGAGINASGSGLRGADRGAAESATIPNEALASTAPLLEVAPRLLSTTMQQLANEVVEPVVDAAPTEAASSTSSSSADEPARGQNDNEVVALRAQINQQEAMLRDLIQHTEQLRQALSGEQRSQPSPAPEDPLTSFRTVVDAPPVSKPGENAVSGKQSVRPVYRPNPAEERIRSSLEKTIDIQFAGTTLADVVQYLSTEHGILIRLDSSDLQEYGAGPDSEVNLKVSGITLKQALNLICEDVNGVQLDYVIDDGVMKIMSRDKAETVLQTVVYDVTALGQLGTPASLVSVVEGAVEPNSWMKQGGSGTVQPLGDSLIITASRRVHDSVVDLLKMLEKSDSGLSAEPQDPNRLRSSGPASAHSGAENEASPGEQNESSSQPVQGTGSSNEISAVNQPTPPMIRPIRHQNPGEERVLDALDHVVDFQFTGQNITEFLWQVSESENILLRADRAALTDLGFGAKTEINEVISGITLQEALDLTFADNFDGKVDYVIDGGVLKVTSREKADAHMETAVYDVEPLGGIASVSELKDVVEGAIDPDRWLVNGGQSTIQTLGDTLVVTSSQRTHRKVAQLLTMLQQREQARAKISPR